MQAISDEQLMLWLKQGDRSCLGALFERHHRALYSFCVRLVGEAAVAEDLAQEAFFKVLDRRRQYRGGSFRGWLFNIARNLAYDHFRRAGRHPEVSEEAAGDAMIDQRDAERTASGIEDRDCLDRALRAIPPAAREVILLGRFEFDSYADLATALGCSPGAAKVRMHRAMKALNEALAGLQEEFAHVR